MASISGSKIQSKIKERNGSCNFEVIRGMGIQTIRDNCKRNGKSDVTKNGTLNPSDMRFVANTDDLKNPEFANILDEKHTTCNTPGCKSKLTIEDINRGHLHCAKHRQERNREQSDTFSGASIPIAAQPTKSFSPIKLMSDKEAIDFCNNNMQHVSTIEELAECIPDRPIIFINHLHIYTDNK